MADVSRQLITLDKQINTIDDQILALKVKKQKIQERKKKLSNTTNEDVEIKTEEGPAITTTSVGDAAEFGGQANYAPKIGDTVTRYDKPKKKKKKKKKKKNENVNPVNRYIDNL